jgi:hypothetical protein
MYEHYSISKMKVALCIIALVALGVAYDQLFVEHAAAQDIAVPASTLNLDSLSLINKIESLKLNKDFLEDPVFKSLQDFTVFIAPDKDPGRANPFAPITRPRTQSSGR